MLLRELVFGVKVSAETNCFVLHSGNGSAYGKGDVTCSESLLP